MRLKTRTVAVAALRLAAAIPAAAHHWYGGWGWGWGPGWGWGYGPGWGAGWSWGFGIGPAYAGPWWGYPAWYPPAGPGVAVHSDLTAVETKVTPEHARVVLNGELIGVADDFDGYPGPLLLKPGHYTLELVLKGYRSEKIEIDAKPGRYVPVELKLQRVPGEKPAPWYDRPEGLPVGRVFGPKGGTQPQAAAPAPDTTLRPDMQDQPREPSAGQRGVAGAALDLRVTPPNAAIYLDGHLVGTGEELGRLERGLAITPGKHKIEVVAPGLLSKSVEVDVPSGERQQVVVELDEGAGQT